MTGTHVLLTDPADIHEDKLARDAAFGTVKQYQGDGSSLAIPAHLGQLSVLVNTSYQSLTDEQASAAYLKFTGGLTAATSIVTPSTWGPVLVENGCTGAFGLTLTTPSGSGVSITYGKRKFVLADGTNVIDGTAEV